MAKLTIKDRPTVFDLHEALDGRESRTIGHNTVAVRYSDGVAVQLHGHTIALFENDGGVLINQCGYVTTTTHERLRHLLPEGFRIHRKNGAGFLTYPDGYVDELPWSGQHRVPYEVRIGR